MSSVHARRATGSAPSLPPQPAASAPSTTSTAAADLTHAMMVRPRWAVNSVDRDPDAARRNGDVARRSPDGDRLYAVVARVDACDAPILACHPDRAGSDGEAEGSRADVVRARHRGLFGIDAHDSAALVVADPDRSGTRHDGAQ